MLPEEHKWMLLQVARCRCRRVGAIPVSAQLTSLGRPCTGPQAQALPTQPKRAKLSYPKAFAPEPPWFLGKGATRPWLRAETIGAGDPCEHRAR